MKLYDNYSEQLVIEYFKNISNTVGAVALGIFTGVVQLENPQKLTLSIFFILCYWCYSQASEYRRLLKLKRIKPQYFLLLRHGWLAVISLILLGLVGVGIITKATFV